MKNLLLLTTLFIGISSFSQTSGPWNIYSGANFLTSENILHGAPRIPSFNLTANHQQWFIENSMIYLADTITMGKMYIAYSETGIEDTNIALVLTTDTNSAAKFQFEGNASKTPMDFYLKYLGCNTHRTEIENLYLNFWSTHQIQLHLSKVKFNWKFDVPAEAMQMNTAYFLTDFQDWYLTANSHNGGNSSLNSQGGIPYPYTHFGLEGKAFSNGTCDSAQLKVNDSSIYIIGMQRDISIQSFRVPNHIYKWVVIDNGDGTACFKSMESNGVEFILKGYAEGGTAPMLQSPGDPDPGSSPVRRRWKFTKTGTVFAPRIPKNWK